MISKRFEFELGIIHEKLTNIQEAYEVEKPMRQEHIHYICLDTTNGFICIRLKTYAYIIFVFKNAYHIGWFRLDKENEIFIEDGLIICKDMDEVMDKMKFFLYSGFCPLRTGWYVLNKPTAPWHKNKKMKTNSNEVG